MPEKISKGFVYILTNEHMPGILKIGYTSRSPEERAHELYHKKTGVPGEFKVSYRYMCRNPHKVEKIIHRRLSRERINNNREYFRVDIGKAIELIEEVSEGYQIRSEPAPKVRKPDIEVGQKFKESCKNGKNFSDSDLNKELESVEKAYQLKKQGIEENSKFAAFMLTSILYIVATGLIANHNPSYAFSVPSILTAIAIYFILKNVIKDKNHRKIDSEYKERNR